MRRLTTAFVLAVAVAAVVVIATALRPVSRDGATRLDCSTVRFDRMAWRDWRGNPSPRQQLGGRLAACGTLVGQSRREVRAQLGVPDDRSPGERDYELGPDSLGIDSEFLGLRFSEGVVVADETG
jgi:hypothetical protein